MLSSDVFNQMVFFLLLLNDHQRKYRSNKTLMLQFFPGDKKNKYEIYLYSILWYA